MSAAHTPGPWHFLGGAVGVAWEGQGGEAHQLIPVALLPNPSDGMEPLEWHANAMLIAAAPDLLEALQDLCDTLGECGMTEKARAAIAKAEGA